MIVTCDPIKIKSLLAVDTEKKNVRSIIYIFSLICYARVSGVHIF